MSLLLLFTFAARGNVAHFLMAADQPQNEDIIVPQDVDEFQKKLDELLADPAARAILL